MKIKLTGWKAIGAVVVVGAFVLVRLGMQRESLGTQGVQEIERWLALESARVTLPAMQQAARSSNSQLVSQMAEDLVEEAFRVVSLSPHGTDEQIVARVDYRREGRSPGEGTRVRYLRMSYSTVAGWRVDSETTKLAYYLAVF